MRSILLDTQIQIAARRRPYGEAEQASLVELFGTPERWGTTLRTLLWTRTTLVVPPFTDSAEVTLPVACSYDLEASAASYLSGLAGRRGAARVPVLRLGVLRRSRRDAPDRAHLLGSRGRVPAAGAGVARGDGPPFPWCRLGAARSPAFDACAPTRPSTGCGRWRMPSSACWGRESMGADVVRRIADAVLYEGYLLWPYRKSALKNQQRFTFGGVYPPAWEDRSCDAGPGAARGRRGCRGRGPGALPAHGSSARC